MSRKHISAQDLDTLKAVLMGTDALAMWRELDRLELSPMDMPVQGGSFQPCRLASGATTRRQALGYHMPRPMTSVPMSIRVYVKYKKYSVASAALAYDSSKAYCAANAASQKKKASQRAAGAEREVKQLHQELGRQASTAGLVTDC